MKPVGAIYLGRRLSASEQLKLADVLSGIAADIRKGEYKQYGYVQLTIAEDEEGWEPNADRISQASQSHSQGI